MKNTYITNFGRIVDFRKKGRQILVVMDNGSEVPMMKIKEIDSKVKCNKCGSFSSFKIYHILLKKDDYICRTCINTGDKNPFYGKKHTEEFKDRMSRSRKSMYMGKGNPFYGKRHTEETKEKLSKINRGKQLGEDNPFFGKKHSKATRRKMSISQRRAYEENKEEYSKRLRNNGLISITKQLKGRKTNPEKLVELKLKELNIDHKYNKILDRKYQYDFLIREDTLLEVQGDYWHGNPKFYGKNRKKGELNERQLFKKKRDVEKKSFAEKLGYKVIYIWEDDVKNNNFEVLKKLC